MPDTSKVPSPISVFVFHGAKELILLRTVRTVPAFRRCFTDSSRQLSVLVITYSFPIVDQHFIMLSLPLRPSIPSPEPNQVFVNIFFPSFSDSTSKFGAQFGKCRPEL